MTVTGSVLLLFFLGCNEMLMSAYVFQMAETTMDSPVVEVCWLLRSTLQYAHHAWTNGLFSIN